MGSVGLAVVVGLAMSLWIGAPATTAAIQQVEEGADAVEWLRQSVNLAHLDWLKGEVTLPDGGTLPIWWVYAEPDRPGDRQGPYHYVEAVTEGISCVDDVARAIVAYLTHYEMFGDTHSLEQARDGFRFLEYMRTPEGLFYNFIMSNGQINRKGGTSAQGINWWTARAMHALGMGYRVFSKIDPPYAAHLQRLLRPTIDAVYRYVTENPLSSYGTYKTLHGRQIPAWLVGDGTDASAVALLGLSEYYEASPDDAAQVAQLMRILADGIAAYRMGGGLEWPWGAHLPWGGSISYWHAWGSHQMMALARAGRLLGEPRWIEAARAEALGLVTHMLASEGLFANLGPAPHRYVQLAYGAETITSGLLELHAATGDELFARLAGLAGAWFFGANPAGFAMYDAATGRGWDGIDPAREGELEPRVSFNAGAESTIEALTAVMRLASNPIAARYVRYRERAAHRFLLLEAESFEKADSGRPRKVWAQWTGEAMPSGQFYVTLRRGDAFSLAFRTHTSDTYIPYLVFERQRAAAGQVGVELSVDGGPPVRVDMGGSPDSKYMTMEVITGLAPLHLDADRHRVSVRFSGEAQQVAATVDALVLQPVVEWRELTGDGGGVLLLRSFDSAPREVPVTLHVPQERQGEAITVHVEARDETGALTQERRSQQVLQSGAETLGLTVRVEPFGLTIVEWR